MTSLSNSGAASLEGKSTLIIGASRGIGAAAAESFATQGARVVLAARDRIALAERVAQLRDRGGDAHFVVTDVQEPAAIEAAVRFTLEKFGGLDIAFNNAGVNDIRYPIAELPDEEFDRLLTVNLKSVFVAMKHQIRAMLAGDGGSIVNMASISAFATTPMMAGYITSKHGVVGLTKSAALEYASRNIRVNAIAPGAIMTDMLRRGTLSTPQGRERIEAATPMGRIGSPEEMANVVVWLGSDQASYLTGSVILADGGYSLP